MAQSIATVAARAAGTVLVGAATVRRGQAAQTASAPSASGAVPKAARPRTLPVMVRPVLVEVSGVPTPVPAVSGIIIAVAVRAGAAEATAPTRARQIPPATVGRTATEAPRGRCLGEARTIPRPTVRRAVVAALVLAGGAEGIAPPTVTLRPGRRARATVVAPRAPAAPTAC